MKFKLTRRDDKTATIEAERYEEDGMGIRFYDAEGKKIASFADGSLKSVLPDDLSFE